MLAFTRGKRQLHAGVVRHPCTPCRVDGGTITSVGLSRRHKITVAAVTALCLSAAGLGSPAGAEPSPSPGVPTTELISPLPPVVPQPSDWRPKFPFPYDQIREQITPDEVRAQGEMCQWFTEQYEVLNDQIARLQLNRIGPDGTDWDYGRAGLQQQVDTVTANIDQAIAFLTPRVQTLTQSQDFAGDNYFPLYQGQAFYGLWQQLTNVNNGIRSHQPGWFTGPSYLRVKRLASQIKRSHVCE